MEVKMPMIGSCGHTFCKVCVERLKKEPCPKCRNIDAFRNPIPNWTLAEICGLEHRFRSATPESEVNSQDVNPTFEFLSSEVGPIANCVKQIKETVVDPMTNHDSIRISAEHMQDTMQLIMKTNDIWRKMCTAKHGRRIERIIAGMQPGTTLHVPTHNMVNFAQTVSHTISYKHEFSRGHRRDCTSMKCSMHHRRIEINCLHKYKGESAFDGKK